MMLIVLWGHIGFHLSTICRFVRSEQHSNTLFGCGEFLGKQLNIILCLVKDMFEFCQTFSQDCDDDLLLTQLQFHF